MASNQKFQLPVSVLVTRLRSFCRIGFFLTLIGPLIGQNQPETKSAKNTPKQASFASDETSTLHPRELEIARLDHHHQLLEASLGPLKTALSKLDELAIASARARDYEKAIAARGEREHIETELDRIAKEMLLLETREKLLITALLPDRILLPLAQARLEGVRWDEQKQALTQWQRPGAYAEWTLPNLPPGGYEILLTYQCSPIEGGTVAVTEKTYALAGQMDTTLRGPEVKNLGTLKVTDGSGPFRLAARTVVKSNLMDLQAVELVPANR
jgi:hypothetical protein